MPPYRPAPSYPFRIRLLDTAPRSSAQIGMWGSGTSSEPDVKQKVAKRGASDAGGRLTSSAPGQRSSGVGGSYSADEGTSAGGGAAGGISSGLGTGEGTSGPGAGGASPGRGTGQGGATPGLGTGSGVPPGAPGTFSANVVKTELESYIDGDYFDAFLRPDHYTLQAGNTRTNIAGTDVCVDGEQLRTKEPVKLTETLTDHSKCHLRLIGGDRENEFCPPEANTTAVLFEGHAVAPLVSDLNVCLEYDKSNCRIVENNDRTREVCRRPDFNYTGVWAVGTIFVYNCARWETRVHHLRLQYEVRLMVNLERTGQRMQKEVKRETFLVPRCE